MVDVRCITVGRSGVRGTGPEISCFYTFLTMQLKGVMPPNCISYNLAQMLTSVSPVISDHGYKGRHSESVTECAASVEVTILCSPPSHYLLVIQEGGTAGAPSSCRVK